ncbi:MAG: NMD3-related protein [Candidatus Nanohaloarchaea archaeon]
MELSKFCPRCGEETETLYGEEKKYCPECYTDVNDLADIPRKVDITKCSVCGRMRKRGEWIEAYSIEDQLAEAFAEFAEEEVEMELQFWEEDEEFWVRVHLFDRDMQDFEDCIVEWEEEQCQDCARFQGGFFKAKIQLRGEGLEKVSDDIVDKAAELTNRNRSDFLANLEEVDGGYDFYLSTEKMNKKILTMLRQNYGPDIERSYELVGEEDGQRVYRNVVSVRI